jgi:purine-binding chemotaxis protein CheW
MQSRENFMAEHEKYATFYLSDIYFGLLAVNVQEVLERLEIVPVPLAPKSLPGIINLRGQILPVLDLRERLELASAADATIQDSRMVVVRMNEGLMTLLIDRVGDILDVDSSRFEPPGETLKSTIRHVTSHLCKLDGKLLFVLDTNKLGELPDLGSESTVDSSASVQLLV